MRAAQLGREREPLVSHLCRCEQLRRELLELARGRLGSLHGAEREIGAHEELRARRARAQKVFDAAACELEHRRLAHHVERERNLRAQQEVFGRGRLGLGAAARLDRTEQRDGGDELLLALRRRQTRPVEQVRYTQVQGRHFANGRLRLVVKREVVRCEVGGRQTQRELGPTVRSS